MSPYLCVSTGDMEGMLEIVQRSKTIAKIQTSSGGGITKKESLFDWLCKENKKKYVSFAVVNILN